MCEKHSCEASLEAAPTEDSELVAAEVTENEVEATTLPTRKSRQGKNGASYYPDDDNNWNNDPYNDNGAWIFFWVFVVFFFFFIIICSFSYYYGYGPNYY
jgi:hypothetical protein